MLRRWMLYDLTTGALTGRTMLADAEPVIAGYGVLALEDGQRLRADVRRVNLSTGAIESIQPPAPPIDELRTWEWDAAAERWSAVPTVAAMRKVAAVSLVRQIEAEEALQSRAMREVVLALAAGQAPGQAAVRALTLIDQRIAPLRAQVQATATADAAQIGLMVEAAGLQADAG